SRQSMNCGWSGISVESGDGQVNIVRDHHDQQHGKGHHAENEELPRLQCPLPNHALFFARAERRCQSPDQVFSVLCKVLRLWVMAAKGASLAFGGTLFAVNVGCTKVR